MPCSFSCLSVVPLCFLAKSVTADSAHLIWAQRRPYPTTVGRHWRPGTPWLRIAQESKIPQITPSYSHWGCKWAGVRKPFTANLNIYFPHLFTTPELIFVISWITFEPTFEWLKPPIFPRWWQRMVLGKTSSRQWRPPAWGALWPSGTSSEPSTSKSPFLLSGSTLRSLLTESCTGPTGGS